MSDPPDAALGAGPALIIPFGTSRAPATWMLRSAAGDGFTIRVPHITVFGGLDRALRLNNGFDRWRAAPPPASSGDDRLASLCGDLKRHCDPWRRGQRRFLECYFDFVARHVESNRDALARRLERFAGVFRYRDWVYSALMPLPRAHLHAPESDAPFGAETLVPVDFAFWTGTAAIAIEIRGMATRSPATDRRHARLRRAGAGIVELAEDVLQPARAAAFEAALPEDLRLFWRGQALPAGPLKPPALDVGPDEIQ